MSDYKLPPTRSFKKTKATAEGNCFNGVCAVLCIDRHREVAIIAPTAELVAEIWAELADTPLNHEALQHVVIFEQTALVTDHEQAGA
jgi:hypothetical protein